MKTNKFIYAIILLLLLMVLGKPGKNNSSFSIEDLKINLPSDSAHQFVYTNKLAAFWFGETQTANASAFEGYTILEQRYLKDYRLQLNGKAIARNRAKKIALYPDRLIRQYPLVKETLWFIDSLNVVWVELSADSFLNLVFQPLFDASIGLHKWSKQDTLPLFTARCTDLDSSKPTVVGVGVISPNGNSEIRALDQSVNNFRMGIENTADAHILILFDSSESGIVQQYLYLKRSMNHVLSRRRHRLQKLIKSASLKIADFNWQKAYYWALISMDDLITHQGTKGIWAGLPWFNNYWGRDSFISFTGALLGSGQFRLAKEILVDFAHYQERDANSPYYGRIPNRITLGEVIYNTADGTPWFVKACENYVNYSGDKGFIPEIFPVLKRALDGALKNWVDEYGFLTHGDAETWMDAVGSEGPWSPRGNRAVEIQVLWMEQIRITREWSAFLGRTDLGQQYQQLEKKVRENFLKFFWDTAHSRLVDHLNADGTKDQQVRPNAIFALTIPGKPLLSEIQEKAVLKEVVSQLTYPWGVATLSQSDPNFHPFHHYPPYYVPDAAYHNGLVWVWLNGAVISELSRRNGRLAFQLLKEEARQVLKLDGIGTLSELLEAWPRPGRSYPIISGTVSQAWSLAEFLRNMREDLAGIRPRLFRSELIVAPQLGKWVDSLQARFRVGNGWIDYAYRFSNDGWKLRFSNLQKLPRGLNFKFQLPIGNQVVAFSHTREGEKDLDVKVILHSGNLRVILNGRWMQEIKIIPKPSFKSLSFCQPAINMNLPVFKAPAYDLLSPEDVVKRPSLSTKRLFNVSDPTGDDRGPNGKYTYPLNPHFKKGIFDGKRVKIWRDDHYFYFEIEYRELVNPGWKPESGYQLTYTAITLNFGDRVSARRTRVGMNANFSVPPEYAYNRVIYVGNGIRIVDSRGRVLAEYQPRDREHPIGFVKERKIRFSIPAKYFPNQKLKNAVVLIGGQDDHGGGGLGEFRKVGKVAKEWQGGGGEKPDGNPNVYDVIFLRY